MFFSKRSSAMLTEISTYSYWLWFWFWNIVGFGFGLGKKSFFVVFIGFGYVNIWQILKIWQHFLETERRIPKRNAKIGTVNHGAMYSTSLLWIRVTWKNLKTKPKPINCFGFWLKAVFFFTFFTDFSFCFG